MVTSFYPQDAKSFFEANKNMFLPEHTDDIRHFEPISLPEHLQDNSVAKLYRNNKYRVVLSNPAYTNLLQFLESKDKEGGSVMNAILSSFCSVKTMDRASDDRFSFASMLNQMAPGQSSPAEDEGIPGHHPGSAYTGDNPAMAGTLPRLRLGKLPMEQTLEEDVRAELAEVDAKEPPVAGRNTLSQEFEQMIKKEDEDEAPSRADIPFPPSNARDVELEVRRVMEHRDRFEIKGRTGGVGPGVSVCMFTFHNTLDKYVFRHHPFYGFTNTSTASTAWTFPMTTCSSLAVSPNPTFVSGALMGRTFRVLSQKLTTWRPPTPAV
jgi:transcription initiation factor TFIID subunit 5